LNKKHPGVNALYDFINAFNTVQKTNIISKLHFPHYVHSDGNEPVVYEDGEIFWKTIQVQFKKMINEENWHFSTLDKCDIITVTEKSLQCFVEFNRRDKNKKNYGTAKGIWIATFKNNSWGLQIRSMIPVSGTISSLAGTKMNELK
jgi:hypothetical protein